MGTRDPVAKFRTYAHYVTSREWFREKARLPLLLVVAPGQEQEMRIARIVAALLADTPGLVIRTTTATRMTDQGLLTAIWYQVPSDNKRTEIILRSPFNNQSHSL
jgi:hypothetical protein